MFFDEQSEEDRVDRGVNENVVGGAIITFCLTMGFVAYFGIKTALAVWHFWAG